MTRESLQLRQPSPPASQAPAGPVFFHPENVAYILHYNQQWPLLAPARGCVKQNLVVMRFRVCQDMIERPHDTSALTAQRRVANADRDRRFPKVQTNKLKQYRGIGSWYWHWIPVRNQSIVRTVAAADCTDSPATSSLHADCSAWLPWLWRKKCT